VFTGVSGSGKSSLVFGTIAAESQRLINETYSAFVQGFMPTLARPEVDVLEGLTTAIIVDQERMGANARSTVGTVTDANAMLRVIWSRIGKPHIGPATAFSFNVPTRKASGAMTADKGKGERVVVREAVYLGGMCPRCEGMGQISDINLSQLYDDSKSLSEGALMIPGYTAEGWHVKIFGAAGIDLDRPIKKYSRKERDVFLYQAPMKVRVAGVNLTYEGIVPQIQKSFLTKDVDALQPHIRAFVERAVVQDQKHQHRRSVRDADQRSRRLVARSTRAVGGTVAGSAAAHARFVRRDRPWLSQSRPALRHALRR
jgi:excinuclease UvrABC ATPase subunit